MKKNAFAPLTKLKSKKLAIRYDRRRSNEFSAVLTYISVTCVLNIYSKVGASIFGFSVNLNAIEYMIEFKISILNTTRTGLHLVPAAYFEASSKCCMSWRSPQK